MTIQTAAFTEDMTSLFTAWAFLSEEEREAQREAFADAVAAPDQDATALPFGPLLMETFEPVYHMEA